MSVAIRGKKLRNDTRHTWRVWIFRLSSVALGLSVFAALELICIGAGWGESQIGDDPLVGFGSIHPLFELTADGQEFHTSPARRGYFKEESFAAQKPADEFRIFVFGGSTVQGNPYSIETSFPAYLQIALEQADPSHTWKVVNCGGVSYASYRLVPVMRECLGYGPDMFVFCGGHNQFLEQISFEDVRQSAAVTGSVLATVSRMRTYRMLWQAIKGGGDSASLAADLDNATRVTLPGEVDAALDHDGGLAQYHRDDRRAASITRLFVENLREMSAISREGGVPLLFILPPSNLSDCPPFKSEYSASTSIAGQQEVAALLHQAHRLVASDVSTAISLLRRASEIDPRYALTWYELGKLQQAALDFDGAAVAFGHARDEDVCPLRITSPLESALIDVALAESIPLIDAHALLAQRCPHNLVGDAVLVDHVHPSFRSHEDIAIAIADWMLTSRYASERNPSWKVEMAYECRRRLQALDDLYFLKGQRALRSLKLWAAGRAAETPIEPATETAGDNSASQDELPPPESGENTVIK